MLVREEWRWSWLIDPFQKSDKDHRFCTWWLVVWPRLWHFLVRQVKFNRFLVPNEHPERICLYLVRQLDDKPAKIRQIFTRYTFMRFMENINAFNESYSPNSIFKWENWFQEDKFTFNLRNWIWNLKMPYFWWLIIKLSYKVQTNPFRMVIRVPKFIEFQPPLYEIPQPWSY